MHELNNDFELIKNTDNWQVYSFNLGHQYLGALAVENLSTHYKNLIGIRVPNTLKGLIEMINKND